MRKRIEMKSNIKGSIKPEQLQQIKEFILNNICSASNFIVSMDVTLFSRLGMASNGQIVTIETKKYYKNRRKRDMNSIFFCQ